jgi:hypothetical protein
VTDHQKKDHFDLIEVNLSHNKQVKAGSIAVKDTLRHFKFSASAPAQQRENFES